MDSDEQISADDLNHFFEKWGCLAGAGHEGACIYEELEN